MTTRVISSILCLVILVVAACNAPPTAIVSPAMPTVNPKKTYQDLVVGFTQTGAESDWRYVQTASMKETAKQLGVKLKFRDGQCVQENQVKALRTFIAEGVDVIGLVPMVTSGWDKVFQEAKKAGIPIIIIDRYTDASEDLYQTRLASDFVKEGRKAGQILTKLMNGQANIVELAGTPGSSPAKDRGQGFRDALQAYPQMKIIASKTGDFNRMEGKAVMADLLKQYGNRINALYAHNDDMAIGAIQAIEEYGLKPGTDIKIVSIDATRSAFEAMAEGKLNATIECNPLIGPQFYELALKIANGDDVPRFVSVEEGIFDDPTKAEELLPTRKY